jgi:List-Bact-rpt repeat protein
MKNTFGRLIGGGMKSAALVLALIVAPVASHAQTAAIAGALGNFDVVNNTGQDAHGFEIQLEGIKPGDVYYSFSMQRYGNAQVIPYATGVYVRWTSLYDSTLLRWSQTTIPHAPETAFAGSCYSWGANYDAAGCEHFGVSLMANATQTLTRWLIADPQAPNTLIGAAPIAIAAPSYVVVPPPRPDPLAAPELVATVEAPDPAANPTQYGDAQWMKVFKTELQRHVGLDELVSDNPIVPENAGQIETEWAIIQDEPAINDSGQKRKGRQNQGALKADTRAVVRRYEMYAYTGPYDPVTHLALCADLTCTSPSAGELGDFISAQMTAANVEVPSVKVTVTGSGSVSAKDQKISCGSSCAAYVNAGTVVTLTANPSNQAFSGWSGACSGTSLTCAITVNEHLEIGATFVPAYTLSVGLSGKGTVSSDPAGIGCGVSGGSCSAKFAQGAAVNLTAVPLAGQQFFGWTGACTGSAPTCTVTIAGDTKVQANFK